MAKVIREVFSVAQKASHVVKRNYGAVQVAPLQEAALQERCILVDELDRQVGEATKKHCHFVGKDGHVPLHRAFSVFLFNEQGELLLQKRSANKITFPNSYSNTCCSHPLAEIPEETVEEDALGVRRAAKRRLNYELGIPFSEIPLSDFLYLTRIHYYASGGIWGEHEIDYILFLRKNNVTLDINSDEVSEVHWVKRSNIHEFVSKLSCPITPWFSLILKQQLLHWWDNLDSLEKMQDHTRIHMLNE